MELRTADGIALLGYAGLGATPSGTQPSEWMSATLRGRGDLNLEQSLRVLSAVAQRELPKYLTLMRGGGSHVVVAAAFIKNVGPRLFTIHNSFNVVTNTYDHDFRGYMHSTHPELWAGARIGLAGTGGAYLGTKRDPKWQRILLNLADAHDRGKISAQAVADHLALLNDSVSRKLPETVGPRCLVVWRGTDEQGGGAHLQYTGVIRERGQQSFPSISHGMDVHSLLEILTEEFLKNGSGTLEDLNFDLDTEEVNRKLAELPEHPDERLR
jgi:hypothetical protein